MMPRNKVVRHALDLDRDDRVYLIEALEHSLTVAPFATRDFSAAWASEIEPARLTAYKRGEITAGEMQDAIERPQGQGRARSDSSKRELRPLRDRKRPIAAQGQPNGD